MWRTFLRAHASITRQMEHDLAEQHMLPLPSYDVLLQLAESPQRRLRMTDLADGLVYSRSGLTYQAGQLEAAGLVTRTPGEDDERSVTVSLTPAGAGLLAKVMPGHVEVVQRLLLEALTPADITDISRILGRVRDRMRTAPPRSAAPRARTRSEKPRPSS